MMLQQLHHTLCPSLYLGSLHLHREYLPAFINSDTNTLTYKGFLNDFLLCLHKKELMMLFGNLFCSCLMLKILVRNSISWVLGSGTGGPHSFLLIIAPLPYSAGMHWSQRLLFGFFYLPMLILLSGCAGGLFTVRSKHVRFWPLVITHWENKQMGISTYK